MHVVIFEFSILHTKFVRKFMHLASNDYSCYDNIITIWARKDVEWSDL